MAAVVQRRPSIVAARGKGFEVAVTAAEEGNPNPQAVATPLRFADAARQRAKDQEWQQKAKIHKIMAKYDTNKSRKLEKAQLLQLLTECDESTPAGTKPTDEEVEFILKCADKVGDGCIGPSEIEEAVGAWHTYTLKRAEWDEKLQKYDVSNTGTLSKEEVMRYLIDLNGGHPVSEDELEMVMTEADVSKTGCISKQELSRATALWYTYIESKGSSVCCAVQ